MVVEFLAQIIWRTQITAKWDRMIQMLIGDTWGKLALVVCDKLCCAKGKIITVDASAVSLGRPQELPFGNYTNQLTFGNVVPFLRLFNWKLDNFMNTYIRSIHLSGPTILTAQNVSIPMLSFFAASSFTVTLFVCFDTLYICSHLMWCVWTGGTVLTMINKFFVYWYINFFHFVGPFEPQKQMECIIQGFIDLLCTAFHINRDIAATLLGTPWQTWQPWIVCCETFNDINENQASKKKC